MPAQVVGESPHVGELLLRCPRLDVAPVLDDKGVDRTRSSSSRQASDLLHRHVRCRDALCLDPFQKRPRRLRCPNRTSAPARTAGVIPSWRRSRPAVTSGVTNRASTDRAASCTSTGWTGSTSGSTAGTQLTSPSSWRMSSRASRVLAVCQTFEQMIPRWSNAGANGQPQAERIVAVLLPATTDQRHQAVARRLHLAHRRHRTRSAIAGEEPEEVPHPHAARHRAAFAQATFKRGQQLSSGAAPAVARTPRSRLSSRRQHSGAPARGSLPRPGRSFFALVMAKNASTRSRSLIARSASAHHNSQGTWGSAASRSRLSSVSMIGRPSLPGSCCAVEASCPRDDLTRLAPSQFRQLFAITFESFSSSPATARSMRGRTRRGASAAPPRPLVEAAADVQRPQPLQGKPGVLLLQGQLAQLRPDRPVAPRRRAARGPGRRTSRLRWFSRPTSSLLVSFAEVESPRAASSPPPRSCRCGRCCGPSRRPGRGGPCAGRGSR